MRLVKPHVTWWKPYALKEPVTQPKERSQCDQGADKSGGDKTVRERCSTVQGHEMAMHLRAGCQVFAQRLHVTEG